MEFKRGDLIKFKESIKKYPHAICQIRDEQGVLSTCLISKIADDVIEVLCLSDVLIIGWIPRLKLILNGYRPEWFIDFNAT